MRADDLDHEEPLELDPEGGAIRCADSDEHCGQASFSHGGGDASGQRVTVD